MGLFKDIGKGLKEAGKGTLKGLDAASDVLVDKDAWKHTAQAVMDGPGGKKIRGEDLLNMALDSTMLIPGAGLAGAGARAGVRVGAKLAAREGVEALARKEVVRGLRSPANNLVRDKAAAATDDMMKALFGGGGKRMAEKGASTAGKRAAQYSTKAEAEAAERAGSAGLRKAAPKNQLERMAAKKEAGVGTKVGFGQSRKRILANAALTGGANAFQRAYDEGYFGPGPAGGKPKGKDKGAPDTQDLYYALYGGAGGAGAGSGQMTPERFQKVMADFMEQNGIIDGAQVISNR